MKNNLLLLLVLITSLFSACKDEKSLDNLDVVTPELIDSGYKVTVNVIVKKDDDFSLFYNEDNTIDFTKIEAMWQGVKGNDSEQFVTFNLPLDVVPTQLRLDFGMNQEQEDIILKSVVIEHNEKKEIISGQLLKNCFVADASKCSFDGDTGIIKAVVKDGKREFPSLYPQEAALTEVLNKLL